RKNSERLGEKLIRQFRLATLEANPGNVGEQPRALLGLGGIGEFERGGQPVERALSFTEVYAQKSAADHAWTNAAPQIEHPLGLRLGLRIIAQSTRGVGDQPAHQNVVRYALIQFLCQIEGGGVLMLPEQDHHARFVSFEIVRLEL